MRTVEEVERDIRALFKELDEISAVQPESYCKTLDGGKCCGHQANYGSALAGEIASDYGWDAR